jgi:TPP-dependent pyruvate/acetoin dehydrogenase alpha subunit
MKTPMHMSMGQEAIVAGVCHALKPQDQVLGTYRSHGLYLAKTQESDRFFAEMYGKVSGPCGGRAGSMHLLAPESGLICTSAIVAGHIPVAIGAAFASKVRGNERIVAVFFGDGALDEGAFWESFNMACLKRLPMLFVCEDNGYAVHTPAADRHGYEDIRAIAAQFACNVFASDSTDVHVIYDLTREALQVMAEDERPCFLHLRYYRYLEHVGVSEDFAAGYRSRDEFEAWQAVDPLRLQRARLASLVSEERIRDLEMVVDRQVRRSMEKAQAAPFPETSNLREGVFV